LAFREIQRRENFQIGAHRRERCAQFVGGDASEIACRLQRLLGATSIAFDATEHAVDCLRQFFGFARSTYRRCPARESFDIEVVAYGTGGLGQLLERADGTAREEPAEPGRGKDGDHCRSGHLELLLTDCLGQWVFGDTDSQCGAAVAGHENITTANISGSQGADGRGVESRADDQWFCCCSWCFDEQRARRTRCDTQGDGIESAFQLFGSVDAQEDRECNSDRGNHDSGGQTRGDGYPGLK